MKELEPRIHDDSNGLDYILVGDYYIPDLKLDEPVERRPIGRWGRMHRDYLKENRPIFYSDMVITGKIWTYLADLNEQAQARLELIIDQMKEAEGVTEDLKRRDQWGWIGAMNNIRNRAEEIILTEIVYS
ncbi:MAG: TnpV protein [Clostridiales bacterium]|nr:TnpV protein [Clostridiales bacterium]